jgi:preprotein translocase subunit YajC
MMLNLADPGPLLLAQGQPANTGGGLMEMLPLLALTFLVFYFFFIRPQNKKQKEIDALLKGLKPNDRVVTHSGIIGVVTRLRDHEVDLKIDENTNTRVTILRSAVANVLKPAAGGKDDDE